MVLSEEPEEMAGMDEIREEEDEESVEDDDLPEWAKRAAFVDDKLGRAHALVHFFLPSHLQPYLSPPTPQSRTDFLASLSSGQLLCVAYNACVRKSKKPWGFVSKDSIHDIIALERAAAQDGGAGGEEGREKEGGKEGNSKRMWTFRRTDNLRLWAGALKLRYMLPIHLPTNVQAPPPLPTLPSLPSSALSLAKKPSLSTLATSVSSTGPASSASSSSNSTSTSTPTSKFTPAPIAISVSSGTPVSTPLGSPSGLQTRFNLGLGAGGTGRRGEREPAIVFDARVVAKREEGWEDMLERVLVRWVERAVEERRVAS
ncbi:hypothetical protein CVT26_009687 [Gymnopilus dilepis]|uniref:Uncharacterized protein n=1 Tax=Gymnopilus dilepis TaxID=231916 RepID=A0A409X8N8_9AGAR|nr:hypothetical protein CVT26_009687 [Gymnopilus dilepis]